MGESLTRVSLKPSKAAVLLPSNSMSGTLYASDLPARLSYRDAAHIIAQTQLLDPDLQMGSTGLWVIDPGARFGAPPAAKSIFLLDSEDGKWGMREERYYEILVGRSSSDRDIKFPDKEISRFHLSLAILSGLVSITNLSGTNGIYIGGGYLYLGKGVRILPDEPFLIDLFNPPSMCGGTFLISPLNQALMEALERAKSMLIPGVSLRKPWLEMSDTSRKQEASELRPDAITPQTLDESGEVITPTQIRKTPLNFSRTHYELVEEAAIARFSIRKWIGRGRLESHVLGVHNWAQRLLSNIQKGGMLLPTHSTGLEAAISILNGGSIDPEFSRYNKVHFRYGLGHSYGEIVFVQKPGTEELGARRDIWGVIKDSENAPEEIFKLVNKVEFNKRLPLRDDDRWKGIFPREPEGHTYLRSDFENYTLMELFPQFSSVKPVPLENTYAVLVPDHLYDELARRIPPHRRDLLIRILGTGKTEEEFLSGRDKVARRSRVHGGTFEPKIGHDALFRYELVYFKLVEIIQRSRHMLLRQKVEDFADDAASGRLSYADIELRLITVLPLLPEAFRILHRQRQFPSHDGLSPMEHTLNTLVEAAYLAPAIAARFPSVRFRDVFLALLFHDLGKMFGAREIHTALSVTLAEHHLKMMGIEDETEEEEARQRKILELIEHAGLLSEISMARDEGYNYREIAARVLAQIDSHLAEAFMMNFADVASIPGRSGRTMQVRNDYSPIDVRRKIIEMFKLLQSLRSPSKKSGSGNASPQGAAPQSPPVPPVPAAPAGGHGASAQAAAESVPETAVVAAQAVSDITYVNQFPAGALNYMAVAPVTALNPAVMAPAVMPMPVMMPQMAPVF